MKIITKKKQPYSRPSFSRQKRPLNCSIKKHNTIPYYANKQYELHYSTMWNGWIMDYYRDKSFPLEGWLKPCYFCHYISGNYVTYYHRHRHKIIVPICKHCFSSEFSNWIEFNQEMRLQIRDFTFCLQHKSI